MRKHVWDRYPALTRAIKYSHDEEGRKFGVQSFWCHDFAHVIYVANMATLIAEDEDTGRLAAVAALCHNADRIIQIIEGKKARDKVEDEPVITTVNMWLDAEPAGTFSNRERELIMDAVLHHDQPNGRNDSDVLITLIDADRLVNLEADVIPRAGQFLGDTLRVVDPVNFTRDPTANFKNPKTIVRTLEENVRDWAVEGGFVGIRLPKARQLMASRVAFMKLFFATIEKQRAEVGLVPYPAHLEESALTATSTV